MTVLFSVFVFIIGLLIGSFINAVVYSLHENQTIWRRSICPWCKTQIKSYDLIPVVSFFILGRKCRHCKKKIAWQYMLVELFTAVSFVLVYICFNRIEVVLVYLFLTSILIFIFIYDLKYMLIVDKIVLPATILIFVFNILLGFNAYNLLLGAIIGVAFFGLQYLVSKGKWIGLGDLYLGALVGVSLGWQLTILALFLTYVFGAVVGLYLLISKRKEFSSQVPLGPFIMVALYITLLFGDKILFFYLTL